MIENDAETPETEPPARRLRLPSIDWRTKLRWFAAEIVIVVAGVMIALGAQAAVKERADRRAEQAYLRDLLEEFRTNEERLRRDIEITGHAVAAGEQWRSSGRAGGTGEQDLYVASLMAARFDPVTGTLRSLIDGGDLDLIRDRELRAALAGWTDRTHEHRLTARDVVLIRSSLFDLLATDGTSAPAAALQMDMLLIQGGFNQLNDLLAVVQGIVAMLERESGED